MGNFQIKQATPQDFNAVKALMLKALKLDPNAFSTDYSDYEKNNDVWWQNYLFNYLTNNSSTFLLAKLNETLAGMVGIIYDKNGRRQHIASVVWFYVQPESRSLGIGIKLFDALLKDVELHPNIKKITLNVNSPQLKAINIYKNLGFEIAGTLKHDLLINGNFVDRIIMEKYL